MIKVFLSFLFLFGGAFNLHAQSPFYQDKSINLIVGFTAGSYDDLWPRLIAQYLPKYIPGRVTIKKCANRKRVA